MTATALEVSNVDAREGVAHITGGGVYNHLAKDWSDGSLRADVASTRLSLASISMCSSSAKA